MSDLLDDVAAQLRRYTLDEAIALVRDFVAGLDEQEQRRLLNLVAQGPRPLVAEAMGLDDPEQLLESIQALRDDLANDVYVEYGAGYDPEYHEYRGFGDDGWIEEMDALFDAATSLFRAGQFKAAVEAYTALFGIFDLREDGFHFTRPDPIEALHTDVDAMKEHFFIAIERSDEDSVETAIEVSDHLAYFGSNRYALLDAWRSRIELMAALEARLIEQASQPANQDLPVHFAGHAVELLREFYRRYRTLPDYGALCRQIGSQQGWPYEDVVARYREQGQWEQVLSWAEDGLAKLPDASRYRPLLQEARGQALLQLDRPEEAFHTLQALFAQQRTVDVYLRLRDAARAIGRWEALYPEIMAEMREYVLAETRGTSYPVAALIAAGLVGYACLLEGDWREAVAWTEEPRVPHGWQDDDRTRLVGAGLMQMGLSAAGQQPDGTLAGEARAAPALIREHGNLLEPVARSLPADALLDGAVRLYERLVERAVGMKNRDGYAVAGAYCAVIRSIRHTQGRAADFERYYQGLLSTYSRYSALKDELRTVIEGAGYKRKR